MRILVTGKDGQLGRAIAQRATGLDKEDLLFIFLGRGELDLEQPVDFAGLIDRVGPDVLINAAAYTAVDQAEDEPDRAMAANAAAPGRLAEIMEARAGRIVQISTDYVFDGSKPTPYNERDEIDPQSAYGQSKAAGEMRVREASSRHVIVRTAWVYSAYRRNFPKTMLCLAETRDAVKVVADQVGNPTSAFDLADGLIAMCRYWQVAPEMGLGKTFHLAGNGSASWAEFAREVFEISRELGGPHAHVQEIATSGYPTKAKRPSNSQLDCELFRETFGYASPNWRASLKLVIERVLQEPSW